MADIRKKFKATSTAALADSKAKEKEFGVTDSSFGDQLKIEEGSNKIRIYPSHNDSPFMVLKKQHWGQVIVDGKAKRTTVINAVVHGSGNMKKGVKKPFDIIDSYIERLKELGTESEEAVEALKIANDYKGGIKGQISWVMYVAKLPKKAGEGERKFGLLEIKKTVRDFILSSSIIEDDDEALEVDVFTDPDEGKNLIVKYDKQQSNNKMYECQLSQKPSALSDEELEAFDKVKPLSELWGDKLYERKDALKAIEIITNFDEEHMDGEVIESGWFEETKKNFLEQFNFNTTTITVSKAKAKSVADDDDDEEDEKPVKKKKIVIEEDEDDDEPDPSEKTTKKVAEDEDTDDDDDEEDEKPAKKSSASDILAKLKNKAKDK